jgi:hypothetical protein
MAGMSPMMHGMLQMTRSGVALMTRFPFKLLLSGVSTDPFSAGSALTS